MNYGEFLQSKLVKPNAVGFDAPESIGPKLFDWQRRIVRWALRLGRAALFEDCGLGKTAQQLVWADAVSRQTDRPVLILTPLAVGPQTIREAEKFGIEAKLISKPNEIVRGGVHVTNYQKVVSGRFDGFLDLFAGVVLDESSILKSFMGKTKRLLIDAFANTPYRLACTATPAPNDHMELGNHAEFLGVMPSNEMIARWFIADQKNCGHYRLKGHAEKDYWRWVCSWAVCIAKPSDIGGDDTGFVLPPLERHQHIVNVDCIDGRADGYLIRTDSLTATSVHQEMRRTAAARAGCVAGLVNGSDRPFVVWCNTNYEADELMKRLKDAQEVRGNDSDAVKEATLDRFSTGDLRVLVSKPSICGFGMNWQHCRDIAFVGLSYSYEQLYQAERRSWRFGQKGVVQSHIVTAATEGEVLATIQRKERDNEAMREAMCAAMREANMDTQTGRQLCQVERSIERGQAWEMHHGDCVEVVQSLPDASVDISIFSPPFAGLYIYSDALQDMGNSADDDEFFHHFGYLAPELLRVTVPGRLCVVHCKDLPRYAGRDGTAGLKDFPGDIIRLFSSHGWSFHSRVTIWKCPVVERERTNNNGLLHKTLKRDSTQLRQGMADYLLVFRRPPLEGLLSAKPIERPDGLTEFHGTSDPRKTAYHPSPFARRPSEDPALAVWQRYAEPVWWDIDQMDTLNEKVAREDKDERHICPLQLDVIRRALHLWSEPGDVVLSPFAGIGSEGVIAVEQGRRFIGVELKEAYWRHSVKHLKQAEAKTREVGLFDQMEDMAA